MGPTSKLFAGRIFLVVAVPGWFVPAAGLTLGRPHLTPELTVPPVHTLRIDAEVLGVADMRSLRSGRKGDLWGPYVAVSCAAAPNPLLAVDGMAHKRFEADTGGGSAAVGDVGVRGSFVLGSEPGGTTGYGVRFGAKLENAPSNKDFRTNQTDFFMHLFAGTTWRSWRLSTFGGIGILGLLVGGQTFGGEFCGAGELRTGVALTLCPFGGNAGMANRTALERLTSERGGWGGEGRLIVAARLKGRRSGGIHVLPAAGMVLDRQFDLVI